MHVGSSSSTCGVEAHLALRAEVANLVNLVAGVHVGIDEVKIDLKDVDAQAMLKVRLENTYNILDRTLTTLDENPEIVQGLLETADTALQESGDIGKQAIKPGGAVSQIGGGLGDTLGEVGQGLSGTRAASATDLGHRRQGEPEEAAAQRQRKRRSHCLQGRRSHCLQGRLERQWRGPHRVKAAHGRGRVRRGHGGQPRRATGASRARPVRRRSISQR